MRSALLMRVLCATAVVLLSAACSYPTDQSSAVYVTIASPSPVIVRGNDTLLVAHVWMRTGSGDSTEVRNADVVWQTSNPTLAIVTSLPARQGRVTGIRPGVVQITAIAAAFQGARQGSLSLRISNPLEIDSIVPATVHYGDQLTMYGIGFDAGTQLFARLGGDGFLLPNPASIVTHADGTSQMSWWVPYPTSSADSITIGGLGELVVVSQPTVVIDSDLYEPNKTSPRVLTLDGSLPIPSAPAVRFFNPALMFEDLNGADSAFDWFRFTTSSPTTAWTFAITAPQLGGSYRAYLSDPAPSPGTPGAALWAIGWGTYRCKGFDLQIPETSADSTVIALQRLPSGTVDLVASYQQEGGYGLIVTQGYPAPVDPRIMPDRFEENGICDFADSNFADPTKRIDLGVPFTDTLTLDLPHDVDWLRFHVPGTGAQVVTVGVAPRPFDRSVPDTSGMVFVVLTVPSGNQGLVEEGRASSGGAAATMARALTPGDYYLVVADTAGVPTRYAVCLTTAATCQLPSAAVISGARVEARVRAAPRTVHR